MELNPTSLMKHAQGPCKHRDAEHPSQLRALYQKGQQLIGKRLVSFMHQGTRCLKAAHVLENKKQGDSG
eukprot:1156328-Pelagomonas_calceolata.AAC.11